MVFFDRLQRKRIEAVASILFCLGAAIELAAIDKRRQAVESALATAGVVEVDVVGDGLGKGVVVVELVKVIHLTFEGAPEGFHGAVVDAHARTGHALEHALVEEFDFEFWIGVLEAAVAVNERVGVGVFGDGTVKGGEDEAVVVAWADVVGDDVVGFEIKNGGEVEFLTVRVLEFGDIGEPFLVWLSGLEIARKDVGRQLNERLGMRSRLLGADDGAQPADFSQAMKALFVVVGVVEGVVFVGKATVAIDAAVFLIDEFHFSEDAAVFLFAGGWGATQPAVVGGAADGKGAAELGDAVALAGHFLNDEVLVLMTDTIQPHLLLQ